MDAVAHLTLGVYGFGCEDALIHLLNYVWPNMLENSPHVIQRFIFSCEAMRVSLGPIKVLQYCLQVSENCPDLPEIIIVYSRACGIRHVKCANHAGRCTIIWFSDHRTHSSPAIRAYRTLIVIHTFDTNSIMYSRRDMYWQPLVTLWSLLLSSNKRQILDTYTYLFATIRLHSVRLTSTLPLCRVLSADVYP